MNSKIYELLGHTQPKRETQVRNDAYELYKNEIHSRPSSHFTFLNSEIVFKYQWKPNRVVKAIRRLRQAGIIDIFEYQSKTGFKTTVYTSRFGTVDKSVVPPVEDDEEIPAIETEHDELDDALSELDSIEVSGVIEINQRRLMETTNAIAEVLTVPMSKRAIARATGESKTGVDRAMKILASKGCVVQDDAGLWSKTMDFVALDF